MKIERHMGWMAATILPVSLIFTLYLAPTKYITADLLAFGALVMLVVTLGVRKSSIYQGFRILLPLIFLALYALLFDRLNRGENNLEYLTELVSGFIPFVLLYTIFRNHPSSRNLYVLIGIFILPGLIHLGYMYLDIWLAFRDEGLRIAGSTQLGALEGIKETPRVGRRYLSMALVHLLFGSLLLAIFTKIRSVRITAYGLVFVTLISISLLDARSAYFSILGGGISFLLFYGKTHVIPLVKNRRMIKMGGMILTTVAIIFCMSVAYSSGKSRWKVMLYSMHAAYVDVTSAGDKRLLPYIDHNFWDRPVVNAKECLAKQHFRCKVDQSAYLRTAWMLEGLKSPFAEPWGIGYSHDYMARRWDLEGNDQKFQHIDSSLAQLLVTYGFVGLFFFGIFVFKLIRAPFSLEKSKRQTAILSHALILLVLTYLIRSTYDLITDGSWRYMMALTGIYYGLLHSSLNEEKTKDIHYTQA